MIFESYSMFVLRIINRVLLIEQTPKLLSSHNLQPEYIRPSVAVHAFAWVFTPLVVKSGRIDDGNRSLRPIRC